MPFYAKGVRSLDQRDHGALTVFDTCDDRLVKIFPESPGEFRDESKFGLPLHQQPAPRKQERAPFRPNMIGHTSCFGCIESGISNLKDVDLSVSSSKSPDRRKRHDGRQVARMSSDQLLSTESLQDRPKGPYRGRMEVRLWLLQCKYWLGVFVVCFCKAGLQ